jgi:hypothetical protein
MRKDISRLHYRVSIIPTARQAGYQFVPHARRVIFIYFLSVCAAAVFGHGTGSSLESPIAYRKPQAAGSGRRIWHCRWLVVAESVCCLSGASTA